MKVNVKEFIPQKLRHQKPSLTPEDAAFHRAYSNLVLAKAKIEVTEVEDGNHDDGEADSSLCSLVRHVVNVGYEECISEAEFKALAPSLFSDY